jgi:hypothetical protein
MKKAALVVLALVGFSCLASAQVAPPMGAPGPAGVLDLPPYPESRLSVEMNVSNENILPMFKDLFMSFLELGQEGLKGLAGSSEAAKMMGPMGGLKDVFQKVDVTEALRPLVEPIEQVLFQIHSLSGADAGQSVQKIGDFYETEFAKRGWTRILLVNDNGSGGLIMAYALSNRGGLAFLAVDPGKEKTEIINFGMKGLPDLAAMFRALKPILGPVMQKLPLGMMMGMQAPPQTEPAEEGTNEDEESE